MQQTQTHHGTAGVSLFTMLEVHFATDLAFHSVLEVRQSQTRVPPAVSHSNCFQSRSSEIEREVACRGMGLR